VTREEVASKINEIVKTSLPDFENVELKDDTRINTEIGMDSMTFVYVMCKIEAAFDIKIPHRKWEKMLTFGDTVDEVLKAVNK